MNETPTPSHQSILFISAAIAAGFGLTLLAFYPGVMTEDARYVYEDIANGFLGDWQSPVMTVLWSAIDPIAPGTRSMFLLTVLLYWLAFGVLSLKLAGRSLWLASALLVCALLPPAFFFLSVILRDVLMGSTWLLAAALCFAFADYKGTLRVLVLVLASSLLTFGVLLRPNALLAAPFLLAYILKPERFSWRRAAILYVPAVLALLAVVQLVYYGALGATRQSPLQSVLVFDLGGISHFAKENRFPGSWTSSETALLTAECYKPVHWSVYWNLAPCTFVMQRLEQEKLFGSWKIVEAWARAIASHPVAYLRHRAAFMSSFLGGSHSSLWPWDDDDPAKKIFATDPIFSVLKTMHDALKRTPLFNAGAWLLVCMLVIALAQRGRNSPSSALALGLCGSATIYVLSYFAVGVAADFRYVYWAVLAGIAGCLALCHTADQRT
jgi:hypothetical protein